MFPDQDAGRQRVQKRWANNLPVRIRIGDLSQPQRRIVLALIEAERQKNAKAEAA